MGCPPVRGDNPRALASGLSYVQVDEHGITILYHIHQCRHCTSRDISCSSWQGWYNLRYLADLLKMSDHCIGQMVIQIYFTALH